MVCMVVAVDRNQLTHTTATCMVALAMQHEVDGLGSLRSHKSVVQIRSRTQGKIGQAIQSVARGLRMDGGEGSAMSGVHGLQQVIATLVPDFAHDDPVG